jgi:membrane protease YdiL (CAAX protease family)
LPPSSPPLKEAALLIAISFGWFISWSVMAVMNGFPSSASLSDAALAGMMLTELMFGAMALAFLHLRGYQLKELLPSPSWRGCLDGMVVCAVAFAACMAVSQLIPPSGDTIQPIAQIVANAKPSLGVVVLLSMLNGLYEETFLLGYLVRGFAPSGASFALGISVLVRLLYHLYQGPNGAVSVVVFGLVLSAAYWRTRQLWPAVVAHALADVLALA